MTEHPTEEQSSGWISFILPLVIFLFVVFFFLVALLLNRDHSRLPSALIGKPVPKSTLPALEGLKRDGKIIPGFSDKDLAVGKPTMVVVWGSFCVVCAEEQPTLQAFKEKYKVRVFGFNWKDTPQKAHRFLEQYGNPFDAIGMDSDGTVAINWGVAGAPETFIVDGAGKVAHKYVGGLNQDALEKEILPALQKAARGG
jgi:cytochrome c biogenesis protein CcmG/thiol:disulfide interchange protein DsbE